MFQMFKYMAKRATRLIAYSQDYADQSYYLQPFKDKVTPIYPPIHMPPPDPEHAEETAGRMVKKWRAGYWLCWSICAGETS